MSIYKRNKCIIENCSRLGRNKGMIGGKRYFGNKCSVHHKKKNKKTLYYSHLFRRFENKVCDLCGWDKDKCDRHRIDPTVGYIKENIKIVCPNCHRLIHSGKLTF